jgi:fimbrial chaperone protein
MSVGMRSMTSLARRAGGSWGYCLYLGVLMWWMGMQPAMAASLQVAPTSMTLRENQRAEGLWLTNSGDTSVKVQARIYRWRQDNGHDDLQPTQDLLASPPMSELGAGERQLIRVVRAVPAPSDAETAYRIVIDELPRFDPNEHGMQFVLRYSVPIFLAPPERQGIPQSDLQARLLPGDDGRAVLEVRNRGTGHAQIADLAREDSTGSQPVKDGLVGYVLAGQTMRWTLAQPLAHLSAATLLARINGEAAQRPLLPATSP